MEKELSMNNLYCVCCEKVENYNELVPYCLSCRLNSSQKCCQERNEKEQEERVSK